MLQRTSIYIAIIGVCLGAPLLLEWATMPSFPETRKIHVQAFRYGTSPSIIRANRGDRLVLTFSTRDTGHSFFLQDYRIDVKVSPASKTVELRDPFQPTEPPVAVQEVCLAAGLPGWWGRLVSVSRFRCHVYCGRMHGFEQGDLIVRPNWLLAGSMGLLMALVIIGFLRTRLDEAVVPSASQQPVDLNRRFAFVNKLLKWRTLQFVCTLPVLGEYLQRGATTQVRVAKGARFGNRFFGLGWRWPQAFRGPWLRLLFFLGLGTFSASLAGQPRWTAITLLSLATVAIVMSLVWELRAFCRYLCPVASFISLYSMAGRLMVRNRNARVCQKCKQKPCLRGNAEGWACPYGLSVAAIERNVDCGICTECFKSCPHDNVSLAWRHGAWTERFSSYGEAWQAIVLLVLAMVYSLSVHSPWPIIRDMVNVIDKATWPEFGVYAAVLWGVALGVVPLIFWLATGWGMGLVETGTMRDGKSPMRRANWRAGIFSATTGVFFKKTMPALIPLGLALWAAFFVSTLMVNFTFVLLTFSDPFGWGWDLFGTAGMPWVQVWPSGIPWIQAGLTLTGLAFSLQKGYQLWWRAAEEKKSTLRGFAPTAIILITLAAGIIMYFTNY